MSRFREVGLASLHPSNSELVHRTRLGLCRLTGDVTFTGPETGFLGRLARALQAQTA